jgi:hypothetical protein
MDIRCHANFCHMSFGETIFLYVLTGLLSLYIFGALMIASS